MFDTSRVNFLQNGYYYRIEPLKGINSPDDEWQISFYDNNNVVITLSEFNNNKSLSARMLNVASVSVDKGISGISDGHFGAFSFRNNIAAFSVSPYISNNIDKNHNELLLTNIENVIGKSRIKLGKYSNSQISDYSDFNVPDMDLLDWCGHPSLSPKADIMIFSSDKIGGTGGTDLYLSIKKSSGKWSNPINLGNIVNSKCDEICPFITADGSRLYFASAGHNNVGGYDIFYSDINKSFWTELNILNNSSDLKPYFSQPVNLGIPLNSEFDELFPSSPGDFNESFYFSSNRNAKSVALIESRGGFDLYVLHKVKGVNQDKFQDKKKDLNIDMAENINGKIIEPKYLPDVTIKGAVFDKSKEKPVDSAMVNLISDSSSISIITDKYGKFSVPVNRNKQYEVTAQKKEYYFDSKRIFIAGDFQYDTVDLNFYLPEIGVIRLNFPNDEFNNPYKYTLDTNGIETGRLWTEELKLVASNLMLAVEQIDKIVLVGHTDDVGSDEYNYNLGNRRVDFVIDELVKLGVPRNLLYGRSAGEKEPLSKYSNEELSQYRKRLRRVTMEKFFK
jgi:hypothetical protein